MKKIIYILTISFISISCVAQTRLTPGEHQAKHEVIIVNAEKQFDTSHYISVYVKSNKHINGIPRPKNHALPSHINPKDIHENTEDINPIILKILNDKLAALKQNKELINIVIIFDTKGNVTDLSFGLHENTIITVQEIEEIDKQLRQNIKATFTGNIYMQYESISGRGGFIRF